MFNNSSSKFLIVVLAAILILPISTHAADPGVVVNFDVLPGISPKILPLDGKLPVRLAVTIDLAKYNSWCSNSTASSFKWSVYQDIDNGTDINVSAEKTVSFERTQAVVSKTINDTITIKDIGRGRTESYTYKLYALIECPNGTNATESSRVSVVAGSGGSTGEKIYTCIVPTGNDKYAYSCSNSNLSNCSDNFQCGGKTCFQILKSLCGQPAPPPGSPGTGTGTGTSTGTCDGVGQPACKPGSTQTYPFEIPNPLKGGVTDFASLVKIIAQWIFNLAIPIAVAMIVYSGILFLTSSGEPGKITKAKQVLTYAVIGLAIILIGSGFVTLIQSILELGGTGTTQNQSPGGGLPVVGPQQPTSTGAVGSSCSRDRDCFSGLICNAVCQRPGGNLQGEPCQGGRNCAQGLGCDGSGANVQVIDGQNRGTCR